MQKAFIGKYYKDLKSAEREYNKSVYPCSILKLNDCFMVVGKKQLNKTLINKELILKSK